MPGRRAEFDVVVIGGANTDFVVKGHALPETDSTAQGEQFLQAPGGKGANQAVGCRRLGCSVAFVGRIGDDVRGAALLESLSREGVDVRGVARDRRAQTGVALVMVDGEGRKQILTSPGANGRLTVRDVLDASELIA